MKKSWVINSSLLVGQRKACGEEFLHTVKIKPSKKK